MTNAEQLVMGLDGGGEPPRPPRRRVWEMFDRIAHRYDFLNHLLSMGQDVRWRRRMARYLPAGRELRVLDLATGTADQLLALFDRCGRVGQGVGVDMAEKMLEQGRRKVEKRGMASRIELVQGDASSIPCEDASFDAVTISFGIRNVADVPAALAEMRRVLRPGGRVLVLEFSLPSHRLVRAVYLFYFRHILPKVGGGLSGDPSAYRYLNESVEGFPYGARFLELMAAAGYVDLAAHPLSFGIATIYEGGRPKETGAS